MDPHEKCNNGNVEYGQGGMTLRDYFAAKYMAALEISQTLAMCHNKGAVPAEGWYETLTEEAYRAADAMLIRRQNAQALPQPERPKL